MLSFKLLLRILIVPLINRRTFVTLSFIIITILSCILGSFFAIANKVTIILSIIMIIYIISQILNLRKILIQWRKEISEGDINQQHFKFTQFILFLVTMIFILVIAFSPLYFAESNLDIGLENRLYLNNISYFQCLYYSVITASTIGSGDFVPKHFFSRITTIVQIIISPALILGYFGLYIQNLNVLPEKLRECLLILGALKEKLITRPE